MKENEAGRERAPSHDAGGPSAQAPPPTGALTFLVVRHAESEANAGAYFASQSDSPLTPLGREQSSALAAALAKTTIDAVYSSDLSRAVDTVVNVAAARGLEIVRTSLLRERAMGDLTGLSFEQAKIRYPELWTRLVARDPHAIPPGGESHHHVSQRARRFLDDVLAIHATGTIVIASHGGMIHHLLRQLVGATDLENPFWFSVANASVSRVDLSEIEPGRRGARLTYVNRVVLRPGEPPTL